MHACMCSCMCVRARARVGSCVRVRACTNVRGLHAGYSHPMLSGPKSAQNGKYSSSSSMLKNTRSSSPTLLRCSCNLDAMPCQEREHEGSIFVLQRSVGRVLVKDEIRRKHLLPQLGLIAKSHKTKVRTRNRILSSQNPLKQRGVCCGFHLRPVTLH